MDIDSKGDGRERRTDKMGEEREKKEKKTRNVGDNSSDSHTTTKNSSNCNISNHQRRWDKNPLKKKTRRGKHKHQLVTMDEHTHAGATLCSFWRSKLQSFSLSCSLAGKENGACGVWLWPEVRSKRPLHWSRRGSCTDNRKLGASLYLESLHNRHHYTTWTLSRSSHCSFHVETPRVHRQRNKSQGKVTTGRARARRGCCNNSSSLFSVPFLLSFLSACPSGFLFAVTLAIVHTAIVQSGLCVLSVGNTRWRYCEVIPYMNSTLVSLFYSVPIWLSRTSELWTVIGYKISRIHQQK